MESKTIKTKYSHQGGESIALLFNGALNLIRRLAIQAHTGEFDSTIEKEVMLAANMYGHLVDSGEIEDFSYQSFVGCPQLTSFDAN